MIKETLTITPSYNLIEKMNKKEYLGWILLGILSNDNNEGFTLLVISTRDKEEVEDTLSGRVTAQISDPTTPHIMHTVQSLNKYKIPI